jgi:hypothetical protein
MTLAKDVRTTPRSQQTRFNFEIYLGPDLTQRSTLSDLFNRELNRKPK